ncbi:MAG: Ni/Fe hydrogenase subunit alpha [Acidobacteria bacterium]|nr:Ni/Fe hydrogenase subunit alpha [Acidobacteriota bacterium]MCK6683388.1 Ni/Fe hydrogenase subunit alpha [Thermoanaerobaculia bacterium]
MSRSTITIDPVTRIEGHAKITIQIDENGHVEDARFHVTQLRGFEKFCEGRPFLEMPSLTARTCGICPVSHLIAAAKACDGILAVTIPRPASMLRQVLNLAQLVQSHALSFFYLSLPDFLLGMDEDPKVRNLFGILAKFPDVARDGVRLRQFGQSVIEELAGKRIHPSWVVPGGVNEPLTESRRDAILSRIPEALAIVRRALERGKRVLEDHREEIRTFANFPSLFMGLVDDRGLLEHTDGKLRIVDAHGKIIGENLDSTRYREFIAEANEGDSFLKSPYYRPLGYPAGIYRVGPLARMNIVDGCGTPLADQEWAEFRDLERGAVLSSFHYHYARLIEILYGVERMEQLLLQRDILSKHVRAQANVNNAEGIGIAEAPRGTLIHHYRVNEDGLVEWANLIIATGHNNLAMNRGILQAARHFISGRTLTEGALNRVEAVIRAFDPCLSCSTHASDQMPLHVSLVNQAGEILDQKIRG